MLFYRYYFCWRNMRILILGLSLFLLASTVAAKKVEPGLAELAATHGYAYVNFPKGTAGLLSVQMIGAKSELVLESRPDKGKNAYGAWLKAGNYKISKWGIYKWGDYPSFEIKAGHITDLGSMVPVNIGGYEVIVMPVRHKENAADINLAMEEYSSVLASADTIRWSPSAPPKPFAQTMPSTGLGLIVDVLMQQERKFNKTTINDQLKSATTNAELLRLTRTVTPPAGDEPAIDPESNLYFGADLGAVRVRRLDGSWGDISIDTLRKISAVEYADKTLVTGSEDGFIRASNDGGASWTILKSFGTSESILDIDHEAGNWIVTTTHVVPVNNSASVPDILSVYIAHADDLSDLKKSRDFQLGGNVLLNGDMLTGQLVNGKYYINTVHELHILDVQSLQWKSITPPAPITRHRVNPKTGLIAILRSAGLASKIHLSSDGGQNWKLIGRPPYVLIDVQFDAMDKGYASRWNMNAMSGVWEIYSYNSAIDDWKKVSDAPFNCRPMRISSEIPLLCFATNGSIYRQKGPDWILEFSTSAQDVAVIPSVPVPKKRINPRLIEKKPGER